MSGDYDSFLLCVHDGVFRAMEIDIWPKSVTYLGRKSSQHAEIGDANHMLQKGTRKIMGFQLAALPEYCPELLESQVREIANVTLHNEDIYILLDGKSRLEDVEPDGYLFVNSYVLHHNWEDLILVLPRMIPDDRVDFPLERPESLSWEA